MKRMKCFFIMLLVTPISGAWADDYPRNPQIDVLHYVFELALNDENNVITGRTSIQVRFHEGGVSRFELDLIGGEFGPSGTGMTIESIQCEGQSLEFTHDKNRISLNLLSKTKVNESRTYVIEYSGIPADGLIISKNKHDERTFFGDNFPDRARHWLPTLDHPSDKATCEFIITVPNHYQTIASGLLIEETDLPGNLRLTHWEQIIPLSTYLMVIGVAHFAIQQVGEHNGAAIQTWVYAQDRDDGFHDFARAGRVMEFFEDYIGPYPYRKLANVQSKTRYGGMENAGNIFYSERFVDGDRSVENTMTHEIVHQWFGDSVTTDDWNHVWLSEGFATYLTHVFNEATFGRPRMVEGLLRDRTRVIEYQSRHPDLAIVDPAIPITGILSTNTYQKAGWVLHMLRREIGDEQFQDVIQEYYFRFRDDNTLTEDFQSVVEELTGRDFELFFRQWFYHPGVPSLKGDWSYDEWAKELTISIRQVQDGNLLYNLPLDIGVIDREGTVSQLETVRIETQEHAFVFKVDREPAEVKLDPNTWLLMQAEFKQR
ncbi:MAG: M1 family peptidase [Planctomycetes bacterium]|nr:M1 family peptidase [Planctomycetota bacterium]